MSKDEFLKIQTCVLKVNIHCDGCKHKVKKILQKIEGVYTTKIDSEQGRVIVSGNIDANTLIKKLIKNGKHAELWGAKPNNNNNQNHLNQFKNLQISNGGKGGGGGSGGGGGGNNNKGQSQKGGGNNQPKGGGGGGGPQGQNPHLQQIQQQMKGFQDMKMLPQFMKDMKLPPNHGKEQNAKSVKFKLPEDEDLSDDDFDDDDYDDDDEFDDDELDDEMDHAPLNKMKPMIGNGHGGPQMPNMMMQNIMNGQLPQHLKPGGGGNGGNSGGNGGGNGKKGGAGGGGGNVPVQSSHGGGGGSGKKGGNGNNGGGNPNQGGGAKGGKNGGGGQNGGGIGGQNKNGGGGGGGPANGNHFMTNGAKKVNDGPHGMPNMMAMNGGGNVGQHMGNMPMSQMGHMSNLPMGQMSNLAAVQGLPASAMPGGGPGYGGGGPGYGGGGPEHMQGNPYYQQQLAAMMMNQQRANGNERFQPMMYARPPPAVNYMPPYPPYPYPPPPGERADQYAMFSDENTSSCSVM